MVRRPFIATLALFAAVAPASRLSGFSLESLRTEALSGATHQSGAVVLKWFIRPSEFVACETIASELSQIRHEYRDRVRLVVYGVATDTALTRSFVRDEMLGGAEVRTISEAQFLQYAHRQGRTYSTPMLVLTDAAGRDRAFSADVRTVGGRRDVEAVEFALSAVLHIARTLVSTPE